MDCLVASLRLPLTPSVATSLLLIISSQPHSRAVLYTCSREVQIERLSLRGEGTWKVNKKKKKKVWRAAIDKAKSKTPREYLDIVSGGMDGGDMDVGEGAV